MSDSGTPPAGSWIAAMDADIAEARGSLKLALYALVLLQVGAMFPDIDQRLPFLAHRSALTHSALVPILIATRFPMIAGLLAGGIAIHLAADLFPAGWAGYALIKIPFVGPLDPDGSWWFLLLNGLVCLGLFARCLGTDPGGRQRRLLLGSFLAATAIVYFLLNEGYWTLLLVVIAAGFVLARMVRRT